MAGNEQSQDFDFWDFVGCAVCHISYSPPDRGPPPVPFWITECGHVLCNSHLSPNQICTKCGEQGIQLIPLQRHMDPPMSDWFRLLPHTLDGIANAVKFQQESLAALVRHYRNQCLQLSSTCDRLRNERRVLRKEADALRRELDLCHSKGSVAGQPPVHLNHNGKRSLVETRSQNGSAKTNSSPRSIPTPVGPLRLTLPPGEPPTFTRQGQEFENTADRPGSSRFAEQYAYHGEDTLRRAPQSINEQRTSSVGQLRPLGTMAPPLPLNQAKRFKPASGMYTQTDGRMQASTSHELESQQMTHIPVNMGPPPTPQRPFSAALRTPLRVPMRNTSTLVTNRFVPAHGPTPSTAGNAGRALSGNHLSFVPQNSSGFG